MGERLMEGDEREGWETADRMLHMKEYFFFLKSILLPSSSS